MGTNLFAVCCTAEVPVERLNGFLRQTYENSSKLDCQPSLLLIDTMTRFDAQSQEATHPPVQTYRSPFIGMSIQDVADRVGSKFKGTIDPTLFAILDEQSLVSDCGLIVQVKDGGVVDSVRVHFDSINAELIRTSMITFDIEETKRLVGHDGVFGTMPPSESKQGKPAPRKNLGG